MCVNDYPEIRSFSCKYANFQITAPAKQVLGDDELPFLEPAASKLAIASNLTYSAQPISKVHRF
jgi:hypothetical protein